MRLEDRQQLSISLAVFPDLNTQGIVEYLGLYLGKVDLSISRAEAEKRMFAKLVAPHFVTDIRPLLAPDSAEAWTDDAARRAFTEVFSKLITSMPGASWAKTPEKLKQFKLDAVGISE